MCRTAAFEPLRRARRPNRRAAPPQIATTPRTASGTRRGKAIIQRHRLRKPEQHAPLRRESQFASRPLPTCAAPSPGAAGWRPSRRRFVIQPITHVGGRACPEKKHSGPSIERDRMMRPHLQLRQAQHGLPDWSRSRAAPPTARLRRSCPDAADSGRPGARKRCVPSPDYPSRCDAASSDWWCPGVPPAARPRRPPVRRSCR